MILRSANDGWRRLLRLCACGLASLFLAGLGCTAVTGDEEEPVQEDEGSESASVPDDPEPDPALAANPLVLEAPNTFNTSPGFIVFFHANIQYFDPTVGPGFAHDPKRLVDCWFDKNCVGDHVPDVIALTECPWNADAKSFMAYLSTRAAALSPARTYKLWVTTGGNKYGSKCVIFSSRFSPGNKATDFTEFSRYEPDVSGVPDNTCTVHPNNKVTHNFKVRLYDTIADKTVRVVTIHNPVFAKSAHPDECFHANGDAECALQNSKEAWHQATNTAAADAMRIIAGDFNMTQRCPTPGYYRDNCTSSILGCFDGAARVGYTPGYQYLIDQGFKSLYGNDASGRDPDVHNLKIDHVLAKAYRAWPWSAANTSARPSTSKIILKNHYGNFDRFTDHWYLYVGQAHY